MPLPVLLLLQDTLRPYPRGGSASHLLDLCRDFGDLLERPGESPVYILAYDARFIHAVVVHADFAGVLAIISCVSRGYTSRQMFDVSQLPTFWQVSLRCFPTLVHRVHHSSLPTLTQHNRGESSKRQYHFKEYWGQQPSGSFLFLFVCRRMVIFIRFSVIPGRKWRRAHEDHLYLQDRDHAHQNPG